MYHFYWFIFLDSIVFSVCNASESSGRCGVGIVARNEEGELMFAASKTIQSFSSPEVAELESVVWALQIATREGLTHI